jgi:hypothetical protein
MGRECAMACSGPRGARRATIRALLGCTVALTVAVILPAGASASQGASPLHLPVAYRGSGPVRPPAPSPPSPTATPAVPATAAPSTAFPPTVEPDDLFDADHVMDVNIRLQPAHWDALRLQARTMAGLFGAAECLAAPRPSPYTYFAADVRIDGRRMANVGVRKKGLLGSVSSTRPALKIKFDAYVPGQRLDGMSLMTLNNAIQDPSLVRQCLAHLLFARAGVPAPRCSFARVHVNGDDLGVYAHVESVNKAFLARHFTDDGGNLYEGALSDFRPDWVATFERDTNASDPDRSDLDAVVAALETDDAHLMAAIEAVVDVPEFLDFWAMEVLTGHWDGYAANRNNFYVYRDPASGRFAFIPWGIDAAFRADPRLRPDGSGPATSVAVAGRLAYRLYRHPVGRQRYLDRLGVLLDEVWDESAILVEVDRMSALVRPYVAADRIPDHTRDLAAVRHFVAGRRSAITSELRSGPVDWPYPESGPPCRKTVGHIQVPIAVRWSEPAAISTTIRADLFGLPIEMTQAYGVAGLSGTDPWPAHVAVQVVGIADRSVPPLLDPGDALQAILYVDPARFGPGRTIAVNGDDAFGWLIFAPVDDDGTRGFVLLGMLWGGHIRIDQADVRPGGSVSGELDVDVVVFGGL